MTDRGSEQPVTYSRDSMRVMEAYPSLEGMITQFSLLIRQSAQRKVQISEITVRPHMDMEEPDWEGVVVDVVAKGNDRVMRRWRRSLSSGLVDFYRELDPGDAQLFTERVNFQIR